jgi:hypothetical protein
MLSKDKITEIFCITDDFLLVLRTQRVQVKYFSNEFQNQKMLPSGDGKKRRNRPCEMSDSEIMTILMLFHFGTFKNFMHYYLHYTCTILRYEGKYEYWRAFKK